MPMARNAVKLASSATMAPTRKDQCQCRVPLDFGRAARREHDGMVAKSAAPNDETKNSVRGASGRPVRQSNDGLLREKWGTASSLLVFLPLFQ